LDAFQGRWAAGEACRLTIVGRRGWIDSETIARFDALAGESRLRLVHDADDDRLADILAETDAVIMASRAEGFGLPIVEALALD
ncbi:glycosyltransferase, partial [Acinetobacter baumannii]